MWKKLTFILLFALLFSVTVFAQPRKIGSPVVQNFPREAYKAGPQNWAVDQDEHGVLYFGNNDGLLVYDGKEWGAKPIPLPNKTIVRSLAYHRQSGRVYVGGQGTFGFFKKNAAGTFEYTCLSDSLHNPEERDFEDVWRIFLDGANDAIIFTTYKMVVRYHQGQGLRTYHPENGSLEFAFSIRGALYAWQPNAGLVELKGEHFQVVPGGEVFSQPGMSVKAILPFAGETKLIATEQKGLYTFDGENSPQPWLDHMSGFFEKVVINTGAMLEGGDYAFATKLNGVVIIERSTGNLIAQIDKDHGLPNDNVIAIKQSADRNLWLGLHNGIARADINSLWNFVFIPPYTQIGAHGSVFFKNKLYLVTPNGLFVKEFKGSEVLGREFSAVKGTEGEAWNLSVVHDTLFLGHHNGAYCICSDGRLQQLDNTLGYWKFLEVPGRADLILAGNYFGLVLFKKSPGSPCGWKLLKKFNGESSRIMEFQGTTLWMSHVYKGVWKVNFLPDFSALAGEPVHFGRTNLKGLPSIDKINVFKIDDRVVFGTEKGVYSYDTSGVFILDNEFLHVFGDTTFVSYLVQDGADKVWFWANEKPGRLRKILGRYEREEVPELNFLNGNFKSNFEHINPLNGGGVLFGTADGFFKYGTNPSVPIVLPQESLPSLCPPVWTMILPWLLAIALTFLCMVLYRWLKTSTVTSTDNKPHLKNEPEPLSGLALLIEHGFEVQLSTHCQQLESPSPDISQIESKMSKYEKQIVPYTQQLELYSSNRSWIKHFKQKFKAGNDTFWKVAVCLKNGMNEKNISEFLRIEPTTVTRNIAPLQKKFGTMETLKIREELKKLHELTFEDLKALPINQSFDQLRANLHMPPDKLAFMARSYLIEMKPFGERLQSYVQRKSWLRILKQNFPKLTEIEIMVCIGIRNDLSASEIGVLLYGQDKDKDKDVVEGIRENLWKNFKKESPGIQSQNLNEFIQSYPDGPATA